MPDAFGVSFGVTLRGDGVAERSRHPATVEVGAASASEQAPFAKVGRIAGKLNAGRSSLSRMTRSTLCSDFGAASAETSSPRLGLRMLNTGSGISRQSMIWAVADAEVTHGDEAFCRLRASAHLATMALGMRTLLRTHGPSLIDTGGKRRRR